MTAPGIREATFHSLDMRCETCGQPAVAMVQDYLRKSWADTMLVEYSRDGTAHLFCEVHRRPVRVRQLTFDEP